jgi:mycothiol system anti-sigma-R factor
MKVTPDYICLGVGAGDMKDMSTFNSSDKVCDQVRRSIDAYVSDELDPASGDELHQHLETCQPCSEIVEERKHIKHLVRRAVRREAAPDNLKQKIQEMIRKS